MSTYLFPFLPVTGEYKNLYTLYAYPEGTGGFIVHCLDTDGVEREVHFLWYAGTPSSSTHPNAPDGSVCYDVTNAKTYIKTATTVGYGTSGTWTKEQNA